MNAETVQKFEKILNRKLSSPELERLQRVKEILDISDHDALWDILVAFEYQRTFYEDIPLKIQEHTDSLCKALKDVAHEAVAKEAKQVALSVGTTNIIDRITAVLLAAVISGAALMYAGFSIGSGQTHPLPFILQMPVGYVLGGISLSCGIYIIFYATKAFASGDKGWQHQLLKALCLFVLPAALFLSMT